MGSPIGPPVQVSIPPTVINHSVSSTGTTTTIVAGRSNQSLRLWGAWCTGQGATSATVMTVQIRDSAGNILLAANGYGQATTEKFFGGMLLSHSVGITLAGSGSSMLGGIEYDWAD
jgi:hypothetical protein